MIHRQSNENSLLPVHAIEAWLSEFFSSKITSLTRSLGTNRSIRPHVPKPTPFPLVLTGGSNTHSSQDKLERQNTAGHFRYSTHLGDAGNAKVLPVELEGIKSQSAGHHLDSQALEFTCTQRTIQVQTSATATLIMKPEDWSVSDT